MVVNHTPSAAPGAYSFIATSKDLTVSFHLALDADQQTPVFRLREEVFRTSHGYLLGRGGHRDIAADRHDLSSYLFACSVDDTLVASCRWIPPGEAEYPLQELADPGFADEFHSDRCLEVGRLAVAPGLRGRQISEILLYFSCLWLLRNTRHESYGSICVPKLAGFYEHFGARRCSASPITIPGREANQYVVVGGSLRESVNMLGGYLTRLGWSLHHAPAPSEPPGAVATPVCEGGLRLAGTGLEPPAFAFLLSRSRRVLYLSHAGAWSTALAERLTEILGGRAPDDVVLARVSAGDRLDVQRLARALAGACLHVPAAAAAMPPLERARRVPRSREPAPIPGAPDLATCTGRGPAGGAIALYDARWRGLFGCEASPAPDLVGLPDDTRIVGAGGWSSCPTLAAIRGEELGASAAGRPRISVVC